MTIIPHFKYNTHVHRNLQVDSLVNCPTRWSLALIFGFLLTKNYITAMCNWSITDATVQNSCLRKGFVYLRRQKVAASISCPDEQMSRWADEQMSRWADEQPPLSNGWPLLLPESAPRRPRLGLQVPDWSRPETRLRRQWRTTRCRKRTQRTPRCRRRTMGSFPQEVRRRSRGGLAPHLDEKLFLFIDL